MTIDAYLAELERLLPRTGRRALAEAREHLRDAAARHRSAGLSAFDAEAAATREFGPVRKVAERFGLELGLRETRVATALALGAVAFFVFPLYVVPENSLPPAQWSEIPSDVYALQVGSIGLWIFAGVLVAASAVLAWTRWPRLAALTLVPGAVVLAGAVGVTTALAVRWIMVTPATPNWALAVPLALACLGMCAGAAFWTGRVRHRLGVRD